MPISKSITNFLSSEVCVAARLQLATMADDPAYNTPAMYTSNQNYSDNQLSFVERHIQYLSTHQNVNVQTYIANLRLMTRNRS
jgi:hypothetical protein